MPQVQRDIYVRMPSGDDPTRLQIDGYVFSNAVAEFIRECDAVETTHDGQVHCDHVQECHNCGGNVCHEQNRNAHMYRMVDTGHYWCNNCAEEDAFCWADGRYREQEEERTGLGGYHDGERQFDPVSDKAPFLIGFEVEKEDSGWRGDFDDDNVQLAPRWLAESDGSLSDERGFELVSPAYNMTEGWDRMTGDLKTMRRILGADHSRACGGHISISDMRYSPAQFSDRIRPLFPLLMALYPKRLRNTYSAACKDKDKRRQERYAAFAFCYSHRIELRLIPAVRSMGQLLWRAQLIRLFVEASLNGPLGWQFMRDGLKRGGAIRAHLLKGYRHLGDKAEEKVKDVLRLYRAFSGWYYNDRPVPEAYASYVAGYQFNDAGTGYREIPDPMPQMPEVENEEDEDLDVEALVRDFRPVVVNHEQPMPRRAFPNPAMLPPVIEQWMIPDWLTAARESISAEAARMQAPEAGSIPPPPPEMDIDTASGPYADPNYDWGTIYTPRGIEGNNDPRP